jgi:hypothetical protein
MGSQCRCYAIVGGDVCRVHGGAAPQVRVAAERRILQARTNVICAREIARHQLDLILWQQARREVAAQLLGMPMDEVTPRDLLWSNLRFGRPPLAHEASAPRWQREPQSSPPEGPAGATSRRS